MVISRLPSGGGGKPGIKDGKGLVNLNIFTQQDEPEVKDGIWIKTNNKYQQVMANEKYFNYAEGVWSDTGDTLPITLGNGYNSNSVAYHGEIHIFVNTYHYKFDGQTWTKLKDTKGSSWNSVCIYKDKIYMQCTSNREIEVWNEENDTWAAISPNFIRGCENMVVYNDELYVFTDSTANGNSSNSKWYSWNGATWTERTGYIKSSIGGFAVVWNGEIHLLGGNATPSQDRIYGNDGSNVVTSKISLPFTFYGGCAVVYNNEIHILGGYHSTGGSTRMHYKFDGNVWTQVSTIPAELWWGNVVVLNGDIHKLGGLADSQHGSENHYIFESLSKVYSKNTVIINKGKTNNGAYLTSIVDTTSIISGDGSNNRFISGFDDCFYFSETGFDWTATMYYGDGTKWIKFKN